MKKGRFESSASAKKHTKKVVALLLVMLLLVGSVVGTTLAWLTSRVETVTDTFTVGAVSIALKDGNAPEATAWADKEHAVVPGVPVEQFDPYLSVAAASEACWVFIKVDADTNLEFTLIDEWVPVSTETGVYAYETIVPKGGATIQIIEGNVITPTSVATGEMEFNLSAYAIQSNGLADNEGEVDTAEAAWALVKAAYPANP